MPEALKLAIWAACALLSAPALSAQSPMPTASWVPGQPRSLAESVEYLIALPTARTFLDSLKAEDCSSWRKQLEAALGKVPENPELAARTLKGSLVQLGFEPENIVSTDNFRKSDPVLRKAVCIRHGFSKEPMDPLLIFSTLDSKEAANTAAIFALARNLQRFRLDPVRPVWFCSGIKEQGLSELIAQTGHERRKGRKFFTLLRVEGNSPQVFGNFMGELALDIRLSTKGLSWGKTDSQENARNTLEAIGEALRSLAETAPRARTTPYTQTTFSAVSCQRHLLSSVKPNCALSVRMKSRDMQTMQTLGSQLENTARQVLADHNQSTGASFRILVSTTRQVAPVTISEKLGTVLSAWRSAHGPQQPRDAFLNTGFLVSDAQIAASRGLASLSMSAIEPYPDERRRSRTLFETLARTILVLCGAKIDTTSVPALAAHPLDFASGGERIESEPMMELPQELRNAESLVPRLPEGQLE